MNYYQLTSLSVVFIFNLLYIHKVSFFSIILIISYAKSVWKADNHFEHLQNQIHSFVANWKGPYCISMNTLSQELLSQQWDIKWSCVLCNHHIFHDNISAHSACLGQDSFSKMLHQPSLFIYLQLKFFPKAKNYYWKVDFRLDKIKGNVINGDPKRKFAVCFEKWKRFWDMCESTKGVLRKKVKWHCSK